MKMSKIKELPSDKEIEEEYSYNELHSSRWFSVTGAINFRDNYAKPYHDQLVKSYEALRLAHDALVQIDIIAEESGIDFDTSEVLDAIESILTAKADCNRQDRVK